MNNEINPKLDQFAETRMPLSSSASTGTKTAKNIKRILLVSSVVGMSFLLNSCTSAGYVTSEPTYIETVRPPRPSNLHIWVDGNWVYRRQNDSYVKKNGYWSKPARNRVYISGHWQDSPRGKHWIAGHWQRNR